MSGVARSAYPVVAGLFAACSAIQVFLAGLGVFDDPRSFLTHRDFGYTFGLLILVLLILAVVGRMGRRIIGLSLLLGLLFGFQSVFVALRADMPAIAALHPLNGFAILGLAIALTRWSWLARHERTEGSRAGHSGLGGDSAAAPEVARVG